MFKRAICKNACVIKKQIRDTFIDVELKVALYALKI